MGGGLGSALLKGEAKSNGSRRGVRRQGEEDGAVNGGAGCTGLKPRPKT